MDIPLLKKAVTYQLIGLFVTIAFSYAYFKYKKQPAAFRMSVEYAVLSFVVLTVYYYVFNAVWKKI